MTTRRLHAFGLSGHAHRVELFLTLLELPFERLEVDLPSGAHKQPEYLAMNPLGQVPVLEDDGVALSDSNAILLYLALKYDPGGAWYSTDPLVVARIQRWLSIAAGELQVGIGSARRVAIFGAKLDTELAKTVAVKVLGVMEEQLGKTPFLVGATPTLADVALYSYTAVAPEGGVALEPYASVRAWLGRLEALPRFVPMRRAKPAA